MIGLMLKKSSLMPTSHIHHLMPIVPKTHIMYGIAHLVPNGVMNIYGLQLMRIT